MQGEPERWFYMSKCYIVAVGVFRFVTVKYRNAAAAKVCFKYIYIVLY